MRFPWTRPTTPMEPTKETLAGRLARSGRLRGEAEYLDRLADEASHRIAKWREHASRCRSKADAIDRGEDA